MKSEEIKIHLLKEWKKNPRAITKSGYQRLLNQLKRFGQYKPLLVDDSNLVLGGNMRLKAMRELGIRKVWVTRVTCKDDTERMEYALSDNDITGYYDQDDFFNLLPEFDTPKLENYGITFKSVLTLRQLQGMFKPSEENSEAEETKQEIRKRIIKELLIGYKKFLEKLDDKELTNERTYALWK